MSRPCVLLADDHRLMLEGLQKILRGHAEVVGAVEDGRALLEEADKVDFDVVLLDISMPVMNGLEAGRKLMARAPESKIIFLTMHADPVYVSEAFRAGGRGYVLKRSAGTELIQAIHAVMKGLRYITPAVMKEAARGLADRERDTLPPERLEVLDLVAQGCSITEIADRLKTPLKNAVEQICAIVDLLELPHYVSA